MHGFWNRSRKWIGAFVLVMALAAFAGCASWFGDDDGPIGPVDPVITGGIQTSAATGTVGQTATFTVNAADPQGDALTYAWDDGDAANGTFTEKGTSAELMTDDNSVNWMTNEPGTYTISVVVMDDDGNTDEAMMSFTVMPVGGGNEPPEITALNANNTNPAPGEDVSLTVTASDPDGDTLTYTWDDGGGGGTFNGVGASVTYSNGTEGSYTVMVTVSDGEFSDSASVNITVEEEVIPNAAPVFEDEEGNPYVLEGDVSNPVATQRIHFSHIKAIDPDGDAVTYEWSASGDGEFTEVMVTEDGFAEAYWAADAAGDYVVTLTADDGKGGVSMVSAMTSIQAEESIAEYPSEFDFVGYATCLGCHPDKGDEGAGTGWFATNHSVALQKSVNPNSHGFRNESCYNCHALGWEPNDSGQGFIDLELTPEFANIQCESCHSGGNPAGVGSGHKEVVWNPLFGMLYDEAEMTWVPDHDHDSTLGVGCGACHEGGRHGTTEEWAESGHANFALTEFDEDLGTDVPDHYLTGGSCNPCHSGMQFAVIHRGDDPLDLSTLTIDDPLADHYISCATCHDPHDAANEKQLRIGAGDGVDIPFSDTDDVPTTVEAGWGNICIECHNGRRDRGDYDSRITNGSGHFGPHGNPQGPMLFGIMGADLGNPPETIAYDSGHPHLDWNDNTCVTCHMYRRDYISSDEPALWGHNFEPRFERCVTCHTNFEGDEEGFWTWVEEYEADVEALLQDFRDVWPAEWKDGDGEPENRDADPPDGSGPPRNDPVGNAYRAALWNYVLVGNDGSHGIHNPAFTLSLMQEAIASVEALNADGGGGTSPTP